MKSQERFSAQTTSAAGAWPLKLEKIASSNKKLVLVGMGHPLRSDDFVGSYIAKRLINRRTKHELPGQVHIFDGEDNVEALISRIAELEPEHVIFIDACEMKAEPGETQLISIGQTAYPFFTTHGVPLKLLAQQLLPRSEVWILAIQPKQIDFGEHLSPEIRAVADSISELFVMILKGRDL